MILAAPLVIPFAKAINLSIGTLGMAALADKVNDYIQENPEESAMILKTLIPNLGIGDIFMSKEDKISLEDLDEMTDEEAQDLTKEEKAELMKQAGKSGGKNKRQTMIDISEKLGLSGPGREKQDIEYEVDERYDEGGVEEVSKPKFDYKRFFRKADGGAIGVESLFEERTPFRFGGRGYQGGANTGVSRGGGRSAAMGMGGKQRGGTFSGPTPTGGSGGGGGGKTTTVTSTKNPFSKKNLQTHFTNNQLLADAVKKGILTNKEYNILGGYDATQTLGLGPIDTGVASLSYNIAQSVLGNQPFSDILGDVARNVKGATNISPELKAKYENIIGQNLADGGRVGYRVGGASGREYGQTYDSSRKATDTPMSTSFKSDGGSNKVIGPIEKAIIKKFEDKIPKPDNDPFKILKGYSKTLPVQSNRFFPMFRTETPRINKNLLDKALTELNLSYPKLDFTDEYGFYNTENIKTAVDNAVLTGDLSPIEGLSITQSITTQGDPSAVGLSYDNSLLNFATPDISEGDYAGGINLNLADKAKLTGAFDVTDDKLFKKNIGLNVGDGALKLDQTTYPGLDYQKNVVDLNKDFNLANNLDLNLRGNIENLRSDGSTFRTDKSLTPTLTYTGGIGDGTFKLSGSKEIMEGGSYPDVSFTGSFPIDQKTYIDADGPKTIDKGVISLKGSDLLSGDRSAVLGYDKTIGEIGDNFYLDVGGQIDLTNPENYAGMLKLKKTFKDGGRVGFNVGGITDPQALAIYNSMSSYGFSDKEIADAITAQGYDAGTLGQTTTPTTPTTPTPSEGIIGIDLQERGGGFNPFGPLQPTFTRPAGSDPSISEDAFFGLGRFLQGKERGTLGNRLQKQFQTGQKLPSFAAAIAGAQSPFNINSKNYNPDFVDQLNYLEGMDGLIGMSSVGLKYGPESVLFGKNVISGFGTNNYQKALEKFIAKARGDRKIKAQEELDNFLAAQEEKRKAEEQRQKDIQEAATRRTYSLQDLQDPSDRGTGQSYAAARARTASRVGPGGNVKAYGLKDGGLVSMFVEKR